MVDVAHEKYMRLMSEIEDLEDEIETYEKGDGIVLEGEELENEIKVMREKLIEKRNELKRISDGCGKV